MIFDYWIGLIYFQYYFIIIYWDVEILYSQFIIIYFCVDIILYYFIMSDIFGDIIDY